MAVELRDLLRKLAEIEPLPVPAGEPGVTTTAEDGASVICAPVLSAYLDLRPQATGERPSFRSGELIIKQRMREIEKTFLPRGTALDSVRADRDRIEAYMRKALPTFVQGVAIFASRQHGLFETLEVGTTFQNEVTASAEPSLFQLAHLMDDHETAVVAVVDTNTARLFVTERGGLQEVIGVNDDPRMYRKVRKVGQERYHRRAENLRERFAGEVAKQIEQLVVSEEAAQVILAGDAVAIPLLRQALSPGVAKLVHEQPLTLDIKTPRDAVAKRVVPLIQAAEAEQDRSVVDQLVSAVRSGGLGVAGLEDTRHVLEQGQAEALVLAADAGLPMETRDELIELAAKSAARTEVVQGSAALREMGGVGALLRYR